MSLASWMKLATCRRRNAAVLCLGSLAVAAGTNHWKSPSLLQQQQQQASPPAKEYENNMNPSLSSLYPDVRPPSRKWTSWSSMLWGRPAWPTQFERFQDELVTRHKYQVLPDPADVMIPSHAIAGALLKEHYIEAYRVFSKGSVDDDNDSTTSTLQRTQQAAESKEPQVVALVRLGTRVDGHYGIVHGGIVAMLVDDVLGYGFYSIGWPAAFTANLSVNYRQPIPAGTILKIECYFQGQERRKLYWTIRVVDARKPDCLYVDATSLFVIPKQIYRQVMDKESKINKEM